MRNDAIRMEGVRCLLATALVIGLTATVHAATPKAKSAKKPLIKPAITSAATEAFSKKKHVILCFHSKTIKDSQGDCNKLEKALPANEVTMVKVDTEDNPELLDAYAIGYAPTAILIRRDAGLYKRWIVDMPEAEIKAALKKTVRTDKAQRDIGASIQEGKPQLLFFMASWCGYCRKLAPEVAKFKADYGDRVDVMEIDIERMPSAGSSYEIEGVPVVIVTDRSGLNAYRAGYPAGYDQYVDMFTQLGVDMKTTKRAKQSSRPLVEKI